MRDGRRRRVERPRGGSGWSPSGVALSVVLHLLGGRLIFLAPHPMPAAHPTAYTVEIVDPSALGGKLLAGPIGGAEAKREAGTPKPPPPPEPPPPLNHRPRPRSRRHHRSRSRRSTSLAAAHLRTTRTTKRCPLGHTGNDRDAAAGADRAPDGAADRATDGASDRAGDGASRAARASATAVASAKPKPTATPATVIAKKSRLRPRAPVVVRSKPRRPPAPSRGRSRGRPRRTADDLDGKLAEAIKGVEAKVEKSGRGGGLGGATGSRWRPGRDRAHASTGPRGIGGEGPGGGGTVRGLEFVVYYNQMLNRIKDRWTWVGTRSDLRVTSPVQHLAVGGDHEHPPEERSGDQSFDASVERAVKGAGPLPPPPEAYRSDFADVELSSVRPICSDEASDAAPSRLERARKEESIVGFNGDGSGAVARWWTAVALALSALLAAEQTSVRRCEGTIVGPGATSFPIAVSPLKTTSGAERAAGDIRRHRRQGSRSLRSLSRHRSRRLHRESPDARASPPTRSTSRTGRRSVRRPW